MIGCHTLLPRVTSREPTGCQSCARVFLAACTRRPPQNCASATHLLSLSDRRQVSGPSLTLPFSISPFLTKQRLAQSADFRYASQCRLGPPHPRCGRKNSTAPATAMGLSTRATGATLRKHKEFAMHIRRALVSTSHRLKTRTRASRANHGVAWLRTSRT